MEAVTLSTVLLNGDIPKITVGVSSGTSMIRLPAYAEIHLAMAIFDQLRHPEAPEVWIFSEAEYVILVSEHGINLTFEGV